MKKVNQISHIGPSAPMIYDTGNGPQVQGYSYFMAKKAAEAANREAEKEAEVDRKATNRELKQINLRVQLEAEGPRVVYPPRGSLQRAAKGASVVLPSTASGIRFPTASDNYVSNLTKTATSINNLVSYETLEAIHGFLHEDFNKLEQSWKNNLLERELKKLDSSFKKLKTKSAIQREKEKITGSVKRALVPKDVTDDWLKDFCTFANRYIAGEGDIGEIYMDQSPLDSERDGSIGTILRLHFPTTVNEYESYYKNSPFVRDRENARS